jgi:large subunit ribosomal protein L4
MSTVDIVNTKNEKVGEIELSAKVFDLDIKEHLLHDVVRQQRAAKNKEHEKETTGEIRKNKNK